MGVPSQYNIKFTPYSSEMRRPVTKACSRKTGENQYEIILSEDFMSETILRPELFHIADGHCEEKKSFIDYIKALYWQEPKTIFHSW